MKTKQFKPMLAATLEQSDLSKVCYPVLASPKLDGIRCVIRNGKALTRSLKPVPNKAIRAYLEALPCLEGCDGELMIDDVPFQTVTSMVMSPDKNPHEGWYYAVFDWHDAMCPSEVFRSRLEDADARAEQANSDHVVFLQHVTINSERELADFEENMLAEGFEGVMLRDPEGTYKFGRSTLREGGLMKLKRFCDDEAKVIGVVELTHNENEAFEGELGQTKRSTAKAGKVGGDTLGALVVLHPTFGEFEIGTGFTAAQRDELWSLPRPKLMGQLVKFKYFPVGVKDKPRHPVFLGLRDQLDM